MSLRLQKPVLVKFQFQISVKVSGDHDMERASKTRGCGDSNRVFIDALASSSSSKNDTALTPSSFHRRSTASPSPHSNSNGAARHHRPLSDLFGFAAFVLVSGFLSDRSDGSVLTAAGKTTVLKLQVGLSGMGHSLQKDLNRIAEVADTSSPKGWSYVLSGEAPKHTTLALLRHPDYCISGYSSVSINLGIENAEERFNKLSTEERGKFDEETLVNLNNIKRQSTRSQGSNGLINEYLVITILVAAKGVLKIPSIKGRGKLKEALQILGSIHPSELLAVEVLWTPQSENDTLSEQELREDCPLLRPL
ncbi:myelin-associated oligodendrocyte basic protein [Trifolium repens]|nr:myelin-associated oligodendrocyte basic protein [Trifolium repens]